MRVSIELLERRTLVTMRLGYAFTVPVAMRCANGSSGPPVQRCPNSENKALCLYGFVAGIAINCWASPGARLARRSVVRNATKWCWSPPRTRRMWTKRPGRAIRCSRAATSTLPLNHSSQVQLATSQKGAPRPRFRQPPRRRSRSMGSRIGFLLRSRALSCRRCTPCC
jgi:hypothetical protein